MELELIFLLTGIIIGILIDKTELTPCLLDISVQTISFQCVISFHLK